jgi:3-deoxy-manno-octulosonate cytidylyltransferase (CMP-KDO synthetase)
MSFKVVIPARYASMRLPGKPLLDIGGRPMIQWVIEAAKRSRADEVLVATDDERVAAAAFDPNEPQRSLAAMTGSEHQSGTDRIAAVAAERRWADDTIVVNVQGDEPQLPPVLIDQVAALLEQYPAAHIATLSTPIASLQEFLDPNVVKVVTAAGNVALYFSRAPIPWNRDSAPSGFTSQASFAGAQRHLGIYAYRVAALQRLTATPPSSLEVTEKLEQLRALQTGMQIVVAVAAAKTGIGVDTEEDLVRVRASLQRGR